MSTYRRHATVAGAAIYPDGTVRPEDYRRFEENLRRLPEPAAAYWQSLLEMVPLVRLKVNLSRLLGILLLRPVRTVIPEGVDSQEFRMLELLIPLGATEQAVGHELLNLRERQALVDCLRPVINAYRSKGGLLDGKEQSQGG